MAFRGRGRGRGRGGFGSIEYAKPEPFVIFPEITLPVPKLITKDYDLVVRYYKYENFWRNSPYHLGDGVLKRENESLDIERFSDALKPKSSKSNKSGSFYDYLVLRPDNFPRDLLGDTRRDRPMKRAKWSLDPDLTKLDVLEKLEAKGQDGEKDKKGEEEDDDEPPVDDGSDDSDNGDYDQNRDFDDDDDDYNQEDDGGYEDVY